MSNAKKTCICLESGLCVITQQTINHCADLGGTGLSPQDRHLLKGYMAIKTVKAKRVYSDSGKPEPDERFPFTERYFHKAFGEQGRDRGLMSLEEIEIACVLYADGDRHEHADSDRYEFDQFYVQSKDEDIFLSSDLKRDYDPEWGDDDARWSFSLVRNKD